LLFEAPCKLSDETFSAIPKFPDTVVIALFSHILFSIFEKPLIRPNNKKKIMKPMMARGAANFKSKGLREINPRTIITFANFGVDKLRG